MKKSFFSPSLSLLVLVLVTSCGAQNKPEGTQALFDSKAEAEKAAKNFNCTGAHKMGEKWMPCKKHHDHGNHHHHH